MTSLPETTPAPKPVAATENQSVGELLRRPGILELLLAALSFLLYCGTLAFKFVYDDRMQIVDNASITAWRYVPTYFTGNVWQLIDVHVLANYYRPLFLLFLRLNHAAFGLEPMGWHATTLALHVIVTVQVYWLARRMLRSDAWGAATAALFAVHPVHIESVTWVSGATDPMLAMFMLASTLAYLRYRDTAEAGRSSKALFAASLLFAALALLTKEIAVMLPLLLPLTALAVRSPSTRAKRFGQEALPFFVLVGLYLAVRTAALHGFAHPLTTVSNRIMFQTWPAAIAFYARQLVAPLWISPYADLYLVLRLTLANFWMPLIICIAIASVLLLIWKRSSDRPRIVALYAWLLLPLLPALYIKVFSAAEVVHDRYLYVSSIGFCILVVAGARWAAQRFSLPAKALQIASAAIFVVLAVLTFNGEMNWASDLLLFRHALAVAPENDSAMVNLGIIYIEHGELDQGAALLRRVCERNPNSASAAYNYAHFLFLAHRDAEAEAYFQRALGLDPRQENWWIQFAATELRLGKDQIAEAAARNAIAMERKADFYVVLGAILSEENKTEDARAAFTEALHLDPQSKSARMGLANLSPASRDLRSK